MSIKVIQWATGSMGKTCLRAVLDHPGLELVDADKRTAFAGISIDPGVLQGHPCRTTP
ncbi:hypothetical protein [Pseudohalioglobus lutimaris]|uniref:hypothetical protein n=1 Tax=Pseudohalioglobus lutimaris TaxID=1737061 RepID=UPI0012FB1E96|nr:hypothetical protein [Pseudohalioglobus lutimaris]